MRDQEKTVGNIADKAKTAIIGYKSTLYPPKFLYERLFCRPEILLCKKIDCLQGFDRFNRIISKR